MSKTIVDLEREHAALVKWRFDCLADLEEEVRRVNRRFDSKAVPLARQIRKLRPAPEPERASPVRHAKFTPPDDWTPEEIEHYYELAAR